LKTFKPSKQSVQNNSLKSFTLLHCNSVICQSKYFWCTKNYH